MFSPLRVEQSEDSSGDEFRRFSADLNLGGSENVKTRVAFFSPAPDELTLVGKLPSCTGGHIVGLPIPAMVKSTLDANDSRNVGEHALDFHLKIRQRVAQRRCHAKGNH